MIIQKKICMVGMFGVGKTSLVVRFIKSMFADKYLTTLGVKVDKKVVTVDGQDVTLMLWDMAGKDALTEIKADHIRGAAGYILVIDGCRRSTLDEAIALQAQVEAQLGAVPFTCVVNKVDLRDTWEVDQAALDGLIARGWPLLLTSAKSGEGVEALFTGLAERMLAPKESHA